MLWTALGTVQPNWPLREDIRAVALLEEHGGKRIRGDEAQHQKAIHDKVAEDIEEMHRRRTE